VTCASFRDDVAAYVLGILEPDARAAFERHLEEPVAHEGCREALAEAYETTALLGAALPSVEPGPAVWQAIEREIGATTRAASARRGASASRPASRGGGRREALAWIVAAAAAIAAFVLGTEYRIGQRELAAKDRELALAAATDRDKDIYMRELANARVSLREREAALSLLGAPGTQLVQLAAQGGEAAYRASALLNPEARNAMIVTTALKPLPDKDYQLWLIRGNEKISAGVLRTDPSGATLARISDEVLAGGRPDAFAVTIEPPGGMPQPTGPIILLGKVPA
jgi:anti-sigma-K factor RskA